MVRTTNATVRCLFVGALVALPVILFLSSASRHDPNWYRHVGLKEAANHEHDTVRSDGGRVLLTDDRKQADEQVHVDILSKPTPTRFKSVFPPKKDPFDLVNGVDYFADYDVSKVVETDEVPAADGSLSFKYPRHDKVKYAFKTLSLKPRILYVPNFLTETECDELIQTANKSMARSLVVGSKKDYDKGFNGVSNVRTSTQTWLRAHEWPAKPVVERIVEFTGMDNHEELQVLNYQPGQKYNAHMDYFSTRLHGPQADQRAATAYLYLNELEEGGETEFPRADGKPMNYDYEHCKYGLRVRPHRGALVVFYDMVPDGRPDSHSLHMACPPVKGEKWGGTLWLHVKTPLKQIEEFGGPG